MSIDPKHKQLIIQGILVVTLTLIFILCWIYVIPAEDAVILYEHSKHLAQEGVISYGGATLPSEGATDFLWMCLIALMEYLHIESFASSLILNFFASLLFLRLFPNKERLIILAALLVTPYFYSSLHGFSSILFATIYSWSIYFALQHRTKELSLMLLALCLVRPDGVVWGFGLMMYQFFSKEVDKKTLIKHAALYLTLPGLAYFAWRFWYFGHILPLPFYVKAGGERDLGPFWLESLYVIKLATMPIIIAILSGRNIKANAKLFFAFFIAPILFYSSMQLEQNVGNRFVAPMFFGTLILLSMRNRKISLIIFIGLSVFLSKQVTQFTFNALLTSQNENIYKLSKELSTIDGKLLTTEAGRLAYYSLWRTHDSWGLNSPQYTFELISPDDILREKYDLVVAHCNLYNLTTQRSKTKKSRTWQNMCRNITIAVKDPSYKIFLVPYLATSDTNCRRHDIFAVRQNSKNSKAIEAILKKYNSINFNANNPYTMTGDTVCGFDKASKSGLAQPI